MTLFPLLLLLAYLTFIYPPAAFATLPCPIFIIIIIPHIISPYYCSIVPLRSHYYYYYCYWLLLLSFGALCVCIPAFWYGHLVTLADVPPDKPGTLVVMSTLTHFTFGLRSPRLHFQLDDLRGMVFPLPRLPHLNVWFALRQNFWFGAAPY